MMSIQTTTLNISGMSCSGCVDTVQQVLDNIEGVEEAAVDLENASAAVTYNPDTVSENDFEQAISVAGYKFKGMNQNGNGK